MKLTPLEIAMRAQMDAFLEEAVERLEFRGAVLLVRHGNPTPLLSKGYGKANEAGLMNTPQTIFHLASLTKQFTAAAILLLQQSDPQHFILSLPVNDYLPKRFQNPLWSKVTLHQLLNHTSGLGTYGNEPPTRKSLYSVADILKIFKNESLQFKPGSGWNYSNCGYALLGAVIEHVSGLSYAEFLKTTIFDRYEMHSTGVGNTYDPYLRATGYALRAPLKASRGSKSMALKALPFDKGHYSKAYSAGGLYSTAEDLQKWDRALYDDTFLSQESRVLLYQSEPHNLKIIGDKKSFFEMYRLPEIGKPLSKKPFLLYGYGFIIQNEDYGTVVFHKGRVRGFRTLMLRNLTTRDCLIILSNNEEFDPYSLTGYLLKTLYGPP